PRRLEPRRRGVRPAPAPAPTRRRRSSARPLVEIAGTAAAHRLRHSPFTRLYAVSGVLLALATAYLVVAAQATQDVYVLSQLKEQNARLQAEQGSLRYQSASLHGPAQPAHGAPAGRWWGAGLPAGRWPSTGRSPPTPPRSISLGSRSLRREA